MYKPVLVSSHQTYRLSIKEDLMGTKNQALSNKGGKGVKADDYTKTQKISLTLSKGLLKSLEFYIPEGWSKSYAINQILLRLMNRDYDPALNDCPFFWLDSKYYDEYHQIDLADLNQDMGDPLELAQRVRRSALPQTEPEEEYTAEVETESEEIAHPTEEPEEVQISEEEQPYADKVVADLNCRDPRCDLRWINKWVIENFELTDEEIEAINNQDEEALRFFMPDLPDHTYEFLLQGEHLEVYGVMMLPRSKKHTLNQ